MIVIAKSQFCHSQQKNVVAQEIYSYVMARFFHISNISAVTELILSTLLQRILLPFPPAECLLIFFVYMCTGLNIIQTMHW